jgi:hypothetical protein
VVRARLAAPAANRSAVEVRLRLRVYDEHDQLRDVDGQPVRLEPGSQTLLEWQLPEFGGQPIGEIGIAITGTGRRADGVVLLDYLRWDGAPSVTLRRPAGEGEFWRRGWINAVDFFSRRSPPSFRVSHNEGEGLLAHGTRQWNDYRVTSEIVIHLGNYGGLAVRVQGLRRYYGVRVTRSGRLQIVRVRDDDVAVLAETPFDLKLGARLPVSVTLRGSEIAAEVAGTRLSATDDSAEAFRCGGVGLVIHEGALSTDSLTISP